MKRIPFIAILLVSICSAINFSCVTKNSCYNCDGNNDIVGTGELVEQVIPLNSFTKANFSGQATITISKGTQQLVKIRAQQNILDILTHNVSDGIFNFGFGNNQNVNTNKGIFIDIVTPSAISDVSISGAAKIQMNNGQQETFNITISGSADVDAFNMVAQNSKITISGAGNCNVNVSKNLNITIAGAGNVNYKGHPVITQSIAGVGVIKDSN